MLESGQTTVNENALLNQAQAGNLDAFGKLINHHQERLYRLAYQLASSEHDAADLVQETFLRALKALGQFKRQAGFYTYLVRIMINLAHDTRQRQKRHTRHARQILQHSQAAGMIHNDPAAPMQHRETAEIVHHALDSLEPEQKHTLVLREFEQFSYRQIAQLLNVSEGTVKSRLFRARETLRSALAGKVQHI